MAFDDHLTVLRYAGERLLATTAGLAPDTPVPSCPRWTVDDLLAHQAMVHRWARAHVTGADPGAVPAKSVLLRTVTDLSGYYAEGLTMLLEALAAVGPDHRAMTFLHDPPAPGHFWARRQAHETTIHGTDALAARLGRVPTAAEADVDPAVALDGLDELLSGFVPRGRSRVVVDTPVTVHAVPHDGEMHWEMTISERTVTTRRDGEPAPAPGDTVLTGSAAQLYLGLWNRGEEVTVHGDRALLEQWRARQRIRWS